MATILEQLNFFRYSKDTFLNEKEKIQIDCSERLKTIINIIESNIKRSGGDNSPFSNTAYGNIRNSYGISKNAKGEKTSSKGKSWRITKTSIIPKNLTVIQQKCNEINSLLNKMTSKNYTSVTEKIKAYFKDGPEKEDIINKTITDIFMKAVMQPIYCPDYVKFLNTISLNYDKSEIINKKCIDFRQVIKVNDNETIETDTQPSLSEKEEYDLFCKANKEKKYKEGYAQFIGEMYNKKMISMETLINNIDYFVVTLESQSQIDIQDTMVEDILICLCKLFVTVKNRETKPKLLLYIERITEIKKIPGLQKRLQFKILDLYDLFKKRF